MSFITYLSFNSSPAIIVNATSGKICAWNLGDFSLRMSSKKKTEMAKLMKRPAMSELKDSMFRANKRTEKGLAAQHYWTEKAAKVCMILT